MKFVTLTVGIVFLLISPATADLVADHATQIEVYETITEVGGGNWEYTFTVTNHEPVGIWHFIVYFEDLEPTGAAPLTITDWSADTSTMDTLNPGYDARNVDPEIWGIANTWGPGAIPNGTNPLTPGETATFTVTAPFLDYRPKLYTYETMGSWIGNGDPAAAYDWSRGLHADHLGMLKIEETVSDIGGGNYEYSYQVTNMDSVGVWHLWIYFETAAPTGHTDINLTGWTGYLMDTDSVLDGYDGRNLDPDIVGGVAQYGPDWPTSSNPLLPGQTATFTATAPFLDTRPKYYAYETQGNHIATGLPAAGVGRTYPKTTSVAYVYDSDTAARDSYAGLLTSNGYLVAAVNMMDAEFYDFGRQNTIIVGSDTGAGYIWGTPLSIAAIGDSGRSIIGLGGGGATFFHHFGLYISWGNCAGGTETTVIAEDPQDGLWHNPYTIPAGGPITAFSSGVAIEGVYNPSGQPGVTPLAWQNGSPTYSAIVHEYSAGSVYTLWSFYASPIAMTTDGEHLFINMLHTQGPIFADGFENLLADWSVVVP